MLAAIFSSYGNRARLDRFIPVSTALLKKKQLDGMNACMHAGAFVDRRCRIDQLPLYMSFQLCRVCFLRGLVFAQQLSVFSKVDVFFDKRLNSSRKFACFSGSVQALRIVLTMASAFSEHSL